MPAQGQEGRAGVQERRSGRATERSKSGSCATVAPAQPPSMQASCNALGAPPHLREGTLSPAPAQASSCASAPKWRAVASAYVSSAFSDPKVRLVHELLPALPLPAVSAGSSVRAGAAAVGGRQGRAR